VQILADEANAFLSSNIGKYIVLRSQGECERATDDLIECDPNDADKIRRLQNKILVCTEAINWMHEAIQEAFNEGYEQHIYDDPSEGYGGAV